MIDAAQQDRVMALADALLKVLAGFDGKETQTALTVAVASTIIALYPESDWPSAAEGLAAAVGDILQSREHVEFIKSAIKPTLRGQA